MKPNTIRRIASAVVFAAAVGGFAGAASADVIRDSTGTPKNAQMNFGDTFYSSTWDRVANKPDTATRWPTWNEVTGKPSTFPSRWEQIINKPKYFPPPPGHYDDRYMRAPTGGVPSYVVCGNLVLHLRELTPDRVLYLTCGTGNKANCGSITFDRKTGEYHSSNRKGAYGSGDRAACMVGLEKLGKQGKTDIQFKPQIQITPN